MKTPEVINAICDAIAKGESLRTICSWYGMPSRITVHNWLKEDEEFQIKYSDAHDMQADFYAEQIIDIADDSINDYRVDEKRGLVLNQEHVQRSKLRIDARKWVASKLKPKKYGDKVQTDITSNGKPIKNEYHIHPVTTAANGED